MATRRLTIAALGGEAGEVIAELFREWREMALDGSRLAAVDTFAERLRANGPSLPVVYYTEWIDHWSMDDEVSGPDVCQGRRFEATSLTPDEADEWSAQCGTQFPEQRWFAARLHEAASAHQFLVESAAIVVLREVLGPSAIEDEIADSLRVVPDWLLRAGVSMTSAAGR